MGDALVRFRLVDLQLGAYVTAHVHVCDIDGKDLEGGTGVEALVEDGAGDGVRILQNFLMAPGGTDGGDDAFADTGDDGLLTGAAHQAVDVGADGDLGLGL